MNQIRCLNVVIPANRYQATLGFYRDCLGLPVLHQGEAHCFLRAGGVNLAIHPTNEPVGHGSIYLDFCVPSREGARERLGRHGVAVEREWEDANGKFLLVRDPEGNQLELIETP